MKRPTITDIAREAGVSKGAVSYALNGRPGVSEATRHRITRIARELGWSPSSTARALSGGRAGAIGLVLDGPAEACFPALLDGFSPELLVQVTAGREAALAVYRRWRAERRVDGVLLTGPECAAEVVRIGLPAVVLGGAGGVPDVPSVRVDDAAGAAEALEYLAALGHRHVVRIAGAAPFADAAERESAFAAEARRLGLAGARTAGGAAFAGAGSGSRLLLPRRGGWGWRVGGLRVLGRPSPGAWEGRRSRKQGSRLLVPRGGGWGRRVGRLRLRGRPSPGSRVWRGTRVRGSGGRLSLPTVGGWGWRVRGPRVLGRPSSGAWVPAQPVPGTPMPSPAWIRLRVSKLGLRAVFPAQETGPPATPNPQPTRSGAFSAPIPGPPPSSATPTRSPSPPLPPLGNSGCPCRGTSRSCPGTTPNSAGWSARPSPRSGGRCRNSARSPRRCCGTSSPARTSGTSAPPGRGSSRAAAPAPPADGTGAAHDNRLRCLGRSGTAGPGSSRTRSPPGRTWSNRRGRRRRSSRRCAPSPPSRTG